MSERVNAWSLLVKPTNECNLNCQYCYDKPLREKYNGAKMSIEMVDHIAKLSSNYAEFVKWIWHGGEPTLMGVDWYREVQEVFYKYYNTVWKQELQSNGILLDDANWLKLFKNFDINVGISFDALTQDLRMGSKDKNITQIISKYRDEGLTIGSISVINSVNYKKQIELYEFFKRNFKDYLPAFNHVYRSGGTLKYDLEISAEEYASEFEKYYKYWIHDTDVDAINERSVTDGTMTVIGNGGSTCVESDCRLNWIGINSTGDIYPCDRYVGEKYYMGNIMSYDRIEDIYNSEGFKKYFYEIQKRLDTYCNECGYLLYCKGGCNANHIAVTGSGEGCDEFSCKLYKEKFNIIYNTLREIDIYNDKLNKKFLEIILNYSIIFVKEIKDFLKTKGLREPKYKNKGKELLQSEEYLIYRIFNEYRGTDSKGHVDFNYYSLKENINLDMDFNMEILRNKRKNLIEQIYQNNKNKIIDILK